MVVLLVTGEGICGNKKLKEDEEEDDTIEEKEKLPVKHLAKPTALKPSLSLSLSVCQVLVQLFSL